MPPRFTAEDRTLTYLFSKSAYKKIFRVKPPQRKYRWKDAQLADLWNDIVEAYRNELLFYYLGPISVTPTPSDSNSANIIDGQQRLVTVSILIACIRNRIIEILDDSSDPIQTQQIKDEANHFKGTLDALISREDDFGHREATVVNTLPVDESSYSRYVVANPGDSTFLSADDANLEYTGNGPNRIQIAMRYMRGKISGFEIGTGRDAHAQALMDFGSYLIHKILLVSIETPTEAEYATVFDRSNSRGLDLTISERLKSSLLTQMQRTQPTLSESFLILWDTMETRLEEVSDREVTKFLRVLYLSTHKHAGEDGMYEGWKEVALPFSGSGLVDWVRNLGVSSTNYIRLVEPTDSEDHHEVLRDLKAMRVTGPLPVLLAGLETEGAIFEDVLKVVICLQIRNLIIGNHRANEYETSWSLWAKRIRAGQWIDVRSELIDLIDNDETFRTAFGSKVLKDARTVRYILKRLEFHGVWDRLPPTGIDVEHVLPTSVVTKWQRGRSNALSNYWAFDMGLELPVTEHEAANVAEYLDRLGNKTLWHETPNRSEKDSRFSKKQTRYADEENHIEMTKHLAEYIEWSVSSITQRQLDMAEKALEVWPIPA